MRQGDQASRIRAFVVLVSFGAAAVGCGASSSGGAAGPMEPVASATIGAAGGLIASVGGEVRLEIPPGAVDHDVAFSIERLTAPPASSVGPAFEIQPSGTLFQVPVHLTFALAPADTAGVDFTLLAVAVRQGDDWALLDGEAADPAARTVSATTTHLSIYGVVRVCPRGTVCDPHPEPYSLDRTWSFISLYRYGSETRFGGPARQGQVASESFEFGPETFNRAGGDLIARGEVFSNETGDRYWVSAEAPDDGSSNLHGGETELRQSQLFLKKATNASLRMHVTGLILEVIDASTAPCVDRPGEPVCTTDKEATIHIEVEGDRYRAAALNGTKVFAFGGGAHLIGWHGHWWGYSHAEPTPATSPWNESSFQLDGDADADGGHRAVYLLPKPIDIDVPLDAVGVGDTFALNTVVRAVAKGSTKGGEWYVLAFFDDPSTSDGLSVTYEGLEPIVGPAELPPVVEPPLPAACPGPPDPAAGTLQLASAAIATPEGEQPGVEVVVTRQGGSRGEVSAVLRSADGTATAGSDYTPVDTVVRFADGEEGSRVVLLPILQDALVESSETLTLTLFDPRGCVALDPQAPTVVTIVDDDGSPDGAAMHTVGGVVRGLMGSGLVLTSSGGQLPIAADGPFAFPAPLPDGTSYDVRIAIQPGNPIQACVVTRGTGRIAGADVTDVEVDCAAPPPPGSLDPAFGSGGLVFSSALTSAENAQAMGIAADGSIFVAGNVVGALGSGNFALARFAADGRPDASFGAGGVAVADFDGGDDQARALVLQPDGKIVVVGETSPTPASSTVRFALARFLPNGSLDPQFGNGGQVVTDLGAGFNEVATAALQPDGSIVVAGTTTTNVAGRAQVTFALARYLAAGTLDPAFGTGGIAAPAVLDGARALSLGLRGDGRIVVGGMVGGGGGVACYAAAGALDGGFGAAGIVPLEIDAARALAVQPGDKIVIAGSRSGAAGDADFAVVRLDAHGAPDTDFGNGGSTTIDFPAASDDDRPSGLALAPGDTIVVVGTTSDRSRPSNMTGDFALARLTPAGTLDPAFGTAGRYVRDFFGAYDVARSAVLAPDGALVVGGGVISGSTLGVGILRLVP